MIPNKNLLKLLLIIALSLPLAIASRRGGSSTSLHSSFNAIHRVNPVTGLQSSYYGPYSSHNRRMQQGSAAWYPSTEYGDTVVQEGVQPELQQVEMVTVRLH